MKKINMYKTDSDGNKTISEKETQFSFETEPDYIKIYTKMWCDFQCIPKACQPLFIELALNMSYTDSTDLENSQLVYTGMPNSAKMQKKLGIKQSMYQTYLRQLKDCGAIRQVNKGVYQINPIYASRGAWKYNSRTRRGGVKDLVALFQHDGKKAEQQPAETTVNASQGLSDKGAG